MCQGAKKDTEIIFPAQCKCGHLFLEKYIFSPPNPPGPNGEVGFCWCVFCGTKLMVKPSKMKNINQGIIDNVVK